MKHTLVLLILTLCVCLPASAQHRHEFSFNAGGGLSSIQYSPDNAKFKPGFGGEAGVGYLYFFSPNWGLGTGVNVALYNSNASMGNYSNVTTGTSPKGTQFDFAYAYTDYKETVSSAMLTIPLMLQFQHSIFYAAVGGKVGIPVSAKLTTDAAELTTSAYFPGTKINYAGIDAKGFGTYSGIDEKTDLEMKTAFLISAEAGVKWRLSETWNLYTGIYFDYGLNNIKKDDAAASGVLSYNSSASSYPSGFAYGSLAETSDKWAPLAAGLKLRLSFGYKALEIGKSE